MAKKKNEITVRSSAAEYLTFITASGESGVEAVYADQEIDEASTIRNFRIVRMEGTRNIERCFAL